jgi:hypothetical protein
MDRLPDTLEPYLGYPELPKFYPNQFDDSLQDLTERLFSGEDPAQIHKELLHLEESPGLLCAPYWSCDPYFYLLGLTAELANEKDSALHFYLHLWWNYSKSPFTTMARLKLKGIGIPPTSTPTITTSPTSTPTLMPTVTGTPPTATPTPTTTTTPEGSTPYPAPLPTITPIDPYPS